MPRATSLFGLLESGDHDHVAALSCIGERPVVIVTHGLYHLQVGALDRQPYLIYIRVVLRGGSNAGSG